MKAPKHHHHYHQQHAAPVISPPEGFQSESPFSPSLIDLSAQEVDLNRRLHAKAQMYATEPSRGQHRKDKRKDKKSSKGIQSEPMPINDDSYEMCVASDAELHTLGDHPHPHQSQHYFSLPRNHQHHRPVSASPRNVQTLMRGSQASTGYHRRAQEYEYNYSA
jgi:hypothetical protein